jgi:hypothetical protein
MEYQSDMQMHGFASQIKKLEDELTHFQENNIKLQLEMGMYKMLKELEERDHSRLKNCNKDLISQIKELKDEK